MKLSVILNAKSEVANEIEYKIESLKDEIKQTLECYKDSDVPVWVYATNEVNELKIKYYESLLKNVSGLN